ncbi:hypothetical protein PCC7424_2884 [Gloeothece citriformis PCC 7424]|uniref:DUF2281 domain-containing protein n=1 Tax=Gloeothece citriformis (strain PCC 7424) TaxID=65393 RepID=B7K8U1_GLOC7|nr:hypothetical protein [Gloeothece citriformis]ACK71289.1 hypothetical protein PCC7424_2884 [Gloeothece citriformis PCC 7424]
MNTKQKIIQEIENLSESSLTEILTYIQQIKNQETDKDEVWQAYLESKQERKEVYRRLAES